MTTYTDALNAAHDALCDAAPSEPTDAQVAMIRRDCDVALKAALPVVIARIQASVDELRGATEGDIDFANDPVGCIVESFTDLLAAIKDGRA